MRAEGEAIPRPSPANPDLLARPVAPPSTDLGAIAEIVKGMLPEQRLRALELLTRSGAIKKRVDISEVLEAISGLLKVDFKAGNDIYLNYLARLRKENLEEISSVVKTMGIVLADTGKPMLYFDYDENGDIKDAWGIVDIEHGQIILSKQKVDEYIRRGRIDLLYAWLTHELAEAAYFSTHDDATEAAAHMAGRAAELNFVKESGREKDSVGKKSILQDDFKRTRDEYSARFILEKLNDAVIKQVFTGESLRTSGAKIF